MSDFSRRLAVVIGINQYKNGIATLRNAVNDAEQINWILKEQHGYKTWLLLDQDARQTRLIELLTETLPQEVKPDECLLFYFAGHGIALEGDDGPKGYLIPQDAINGNSSTYLPMTQVHDWLISLPCRHFIAILDCCFAGAFRWSSTRDFATVPEEIYLEHYYRFIQDPAWQVITSASYDQTAMDILSLRDCRGEKENHSPFAAALIEALKGEADTSPPAKEGKPKGDGVITATELYLYLRDRIEPATIGIEKRQTPGLWHLKNHDRGEYIFLTPGHELNLRNAPPLDESTNPYRGLESFDEDHKDLFFGRTALVNKLYEFVNDKALTVVLGASGAGKSSLVRAGLIPELRKNQSDWAILDPIRPGESPFHELNNALKKANLPQVEVPDTALAQSIKNLNESIKIWATNNQESKLLLFIDQSEELITLCKNDIECQEFLSQLAHAITTHPHQLKVVITVRSDFEPQLRDLVVNLLPNTLQLDNTAINDSWQTGRFIVPAMTRAQLREAIEKPAEAQVMYFDPHSLVDDLINEVADMPGALPLLSFALSELYLEYLKRQKEAKDKGITIDRAITQEDYKEIGGVTQSLTQRADQEYQKLVDGDPAYERIVRNVMLRMVALGGGELARRRVPMSELNYPEVVQQQVEEVIQRFSKARLLIPGKDGEDNPYVEPAHDALVKGWQRLRDWVEAEENLELQRRLTPAAQEWNSIKNKEQPSDLPVLTEPIFGWLDSRLYTVENLFSKIPALFVRLWRRSQNQEQHIREKPVQFLWNANPYLDVLNEELKSRENWFNQVEFEFVQESVLQKRRNGSWRQRIATVVILSLSGLTIAALIGQRNAEIGLIRTFRSSAELRFTSNQELEALIEVLQSGIKLKQPLLQIFKPDNQLQNQVKGTLHKAVYGIREYNRVEGHQGFVTSVIFNPSGTKIATAGSDHTARLWDLSGKELARFQGHEKGINSVSFSPDGKLLATASSDGTARLWDLSGKELARFQGHEKGINSVSFSPDGKLLATASSDGTARLWDLSGKELARFQGHEKGINSVSFSPNGTQLAIGTQDNNVYLFDLQTKLQIAKFEKHIDSVNSISFSPDGSKLASAGKDGTVHLWDLQTKQSVAQFKHRYSVESVSFSPQGTKLATTTAGILDTDYGGSAYDGAVHLWDLNGTEQQLMELKGHKEYIRSASFSPDGKLLATASDDGTTRLWDLSGKELVNFEGHKKDVISVVFSPDGKLLATASDDGTTRLWDLSSKELVNFEEPNGKPTSVSFSPNSKLLAITYHHGIVSLWDLESKQQVAKFEGNKKSVTSVSFSPDGGRIAVAGFDSNISLWDLKTKQQIAQIKINMQANITWQLHSVIFSPDGKELAIASADGNAYLLDLKTKQQVAKFEEPIGEVTSVSFSPDGKLLATAGFDDIARLWDLKTKQKVAQFGGRLNPSYRVSFSPDGKLLATTGTNGNFQLWDLRTEQQVARFQAHPEWITSISFSPDGKLIATAGFDGVARLWPIEALDDLLSKGCSWVRDYLENNPNVSESDRRLCDNIPSSTPSQQTTIVLTNTPSSSDSSKVHARPRNASPLTPRSNNGQDAAK